MKPEVVDDGKRLVKLSSNGMNTKYGVTTHNKTLTLHLKPPVIGSDGNKCLFFNNRDKHLDEIFANILTTL